MNKLTGFRSNGSSGGSRHSLYRHVLAFLCAEYDNVFNHVIFQCFSPKISSGAHQTIKCKRIKK